jgi:Transposase domain (DUF772)
LLKAQLLIALYSVRSDRLFCETLDYNILFRWFLDMGLEESSFDASTFSKNRERLAGEEVALRFFDALELLSDEHFSVDGTLIEAWASLKSFRPKDGGGSGPDAGGDRTSRASGGAMTRTRAPRTRKRSCCAKRWARKRNCALPGTL